MNPSLSTHSDQEDSSAVVPTPASLDRNTQFEKGLGGKAKLRVVIVTGPYYPGSLLFLESSINKSLMGG